MHRTPCLQTRCCGFCSTPSILKTVVQFREMSSLSKDLKKDTAKLNHSGALNSLNHLSIVWGLGGFGVSKSEWPAAPSPLTTPSRKTTNVLEIIVSWLKIC